MSHPQALQIPFPEFILSTPAIVDSSQILQLEHEKLQFSCKSHKKSYLCSQIVKMYHAKYIPCLIK